MDKELLRSMVRGAYDLQQLRIQTGNRLAANFRSKLGIAPSTKEEDADRETQDIIEKLRSSARLIAVSVAAAISGLRLQKAQAKAEGKDPLEGFDIASMITPKNFKGDELISDFAEWTLVQGFLQLERQEIRAMRSLEGVVEKFPIHQSFLSKIMGCGPQMSAVIITYFDITKAKYASSLWKFAGLDVGPDGRGRGRFREHLVTRKYIDRNGQEQEKVGISFNPFLKTKLVGVLAACFLRVGPDKNKYAKIYYDYKHRLEQRPDLREQDGMTQKKKGMLKSRRHRMATRYMIKMFLADLYENWRALEGLPIYKPYAEAKLGLKHGHENGPAENLTA